MRLWRVEGCTGDEAVGGKKVVRGMRLWREEGCMGDEAATVF